MQSNLAFKEYLHTMDPFPDIYHVYATSIFYRGNDITAHCKHIQEVETTHFQTKIPFDLCAN